VTDVLLASAGAPAFLPEVVALFVAGAGIAYVCHRLGLVPIAGFLLAGVVIGPFGLGLVRDQALVDAAAEVGVILLLFTIGIEFSLEKLAEVKRTIFGGGGAQVALATAATIGILVPFGVPLPAAAFTGFLVSLSSTAIVLKLLTERGESARPSARVSLCLLIFQDLAIIVMVLLVPMLGGRGGGWADVAWALAKAGGIIAAVLVVARRLMPRLLDLVARTCSPELFLLTIVAVCFGTAYLTSLAGVSLSLGAFLAGLLVSESRFSHHALGEILPLEILFSATFFVSVGMLLDLGFLLTHLPMVLLGIAAVLLVKVTTTAAAVRLLGQPLPVAAASGLMLAQVGEFSFVLERAGREVGLTPAGLGAAGSQAFIAATVVLMVGTPGLVALATRVAGGLERKEERPAEEPEPAAAPSAEPFAHLRDHVVVAGYGQAGRRLARALRGAEVPFVITTLSPAGADEAEAQGLPVLRGDYAKRHTLALAGVGRAKSLVVADDDPSMVERVAGVARALNPALRIVARTRYVSEVEVLRAAGADRVVADDLETAAVLLREGLDAQGVAGEALDGRIRELRERELQAARAPRPPSRRAEAAAGGAPPCPVDTECVMELKKTDGAGCAHVAEARGVTPSARGCEDCLRTGESWVHLRLCMSCGHVGCCDSSRNKHATAHYHESAHPIVRSLEPGEDWGWCYVDEVML
jgi:CPA2 family monovalent cation:H+ antiporter-2